VLLGKVANNLNMLMWNTPRGMVNRYYANQKQLQNYLWWIMQTVIQNKNWSRILCEGLYNFSSLIPLDNKLRCLIASLLRWLLTDSESDGWNASNDIKQDEQLHKYEK